MASLTTFGPSKLLLGLFSGQPTQSINAVRAGHLLGQKPEGKGGAGGAAGRSLAHPKPMSSSEGPVVMCFTVDNYGLVRPGWGPILGLKCS